MKKKYTLDEIESNAGGFIESKSEHLFNERLNIIRKVHGYFGFADGNEILSTVTQNQWVKVTNLSNTLFQNIQTNAGIILDGDDFHFNVPTISGLYGHMKFDFKIVGFGGNNVDWDCEIFNLTQNKSIPVKTQFTTTGTGNRITATGIGYDLLSNFNDRYQLRIRCTSANGQTFTITNSSVWIELSHYLKII